MAPILPKVLFFNLMFRWFKNILS